MHALSIVLFLVWQNATHNAKHSVLKAQPIKRSDSRPTAILKGDCNRVNRSGCSRKQFQRSTSRRTKVLPASRRQIGRRPFVFTVGSTGDSPVPSGDPLDGMEHGIERNERKNAFSHSGYTTMPPGESPGGAGESPAPPSVCCEKDAPHDLNGRSTSHLPTQANLRRRTVLLLLLCLPLSRVLTQSTNVPSIATLAELQTRLGEHLGQPRFAAAFWGVKIVSLDSGKTLFEHNAGKLLKPASNAKLFTGALALDRLGPEYRIKTSFYAAARPDSDGTLHGDLIVYGRGDPSFAARFNGGDYGKSLEPLVATLTATRVKRIEGDLIGDESYFRGPPFGSSWTWDDLQLSLIHI